MKKYIRASRIPTANTSVPCMRGIKMKHYIRASKIPTADTLADFGTADFLDQMEDVISDYMIPFIERQELWREPSVHNGVGTDYWSDRDTGSIIVEIDYEEELEDIYHMLLDADGDEKKFKSELGAWVVKTIINDDEY